MTQDLPTKMYCSVMVEHEGKFLMVKEKKPHIYGKLCLPAGRLDGEESPQMCAIREAKEESGYTVLLGELHAIYIHVKEHEYAVHFCFYGTIADTISSPVTDTLGPTWISREEMQSLTRESFRNDLAWEHGQDWYNHVRYSPQELIQFRQHTD